MPQGTLLSFKSDKGYGFIKPDDGGANIYVHASALTCAIEDFVVGTSVTYDIKTEGDKISAVNVALVI